MWQQFKQKDRFLIKPASPKAQERNLEFKQKDKFLSVPENSTIFDENLEMPSRNASRRGSLGPSSLDNTAEIQRYQLELLA